MPRPAAAPPEEMQARILKAAESQLRRYGPDKLTVTDIARECGMSHPNLYRFYSCKNAILSAVTGRWLGAVQEELRAVADRPGTAGERLEAFAIAYHRIKLSKVADDPEMFRLYHDLVQSAQDVLKGHMAAVCGIVASIIEDGVRDGEFPAGMPVATMTRIIRDAAMGFHHANLVREVAAAGQAEERLGNIIRMLVDGFRARAVRERADESALTPD
ncbi:TetR/AcrR family transcriptional regulator [Roseomonas sp. CCTCC AB2023176]|uniref:TetR/AcrR family transcriptional regulator n=1 Tax=Roseomonas sp. CCTCC AB2023176 TaxID=3342640 RepID=UPI0035D89314